MTRWSLNVAVAMLMDDIASRSMPFDERRDLVRRVGPHLSDAYCSGVREGLNVSANPPAPGECVEITGVELKRKGE